MCEAGEKTAELIIVAPQGKSQASGNEFIARCVMNGIDFYFEQGDEVPKRLPTGVSGVKAIVIEDRDVQKNAKILNSYKDNGVRVYIMEAFCDPLAPNGITSWTSEQAFNSLVFDANLTYNSDAFAEKMNARDEAYLFEQLGARMLATSDIRWYDGMRYNWDGLVDGYEITGDRRYLDRAHEQMKMAIEECSNTLWNCDCVAPLLPMLRVFHITGDQSLLTYARGKFDAYISQTPQYEGCFVNFNALSNHVRSEIIWQVCPGLMILSRVTGQKKYSDAALEQCLRLNTLLSDPTTGLWCHGRNSEVKAPAFWARGEAYVSMGLLLVLEDAELSDPRSEILMSAFRRMMTMLGSLQHKSGFWLSVVNEPSSELESSGTAWITAAMERGKRLGFLDVNIAETAEKGWRAVKSRIWQGGYPGHSCGTTVSKNYAYYLKRPLNTNGWTHFAFRVACERRRSCGNIG
ncbi:MAG: glycoside hydrolase family 88 protein [Sedimentisphaerales bacterium]